MIKNILLQSFAVILLMLSVFSCTTTKPRIVIAPETIANPTLVYQQIPVVLNVADLRTSRHIIQILKDNKAAELINSTTALDDILKVKFTQLFKQQGLVINENAQTKLDIIVSKALITVKQGVVKYQTNSEIIIQVKVNTSADTLTKSFRIRGNSNGPFKADIAVLSRDFNQQLAQLIEQIVNDHELQTFITKYTNTQ